MSYQVFLRFVILIAVVAPISTMSATALAQQSELRYQWEQGKQFAYEVTVTVDSPTDVTTYKGITRYTVDASDDKQSRLTYRGGTNESTKYKESANRGGFPPFGPFGRGGLSIPSPFARPTFAGKIQTTNRITLSSRGGVLALEGDSQLPYLLGNVSLLPFEVLPEGGEATWKVDGGIAITEGGDDRRGRFGPFDPFIGSNPRSEQAASEVTTYTIASKAAQKVTIKKSYHLKTPKIDDKPAYDMQGSGTWTFNPQERMPESLDFKHTLIIDEDNTKVTVPITVAYRRLSTEELAKIDSEAKAKQAEMARVSAETKARREAPLTTDERQATLAALKSGDTTGVLESLKMLADKTPQEEDSEIAEAIRPLLAHENKKVAEDAQKALAAWSPEYKRKAKLNEEYSKPSPVDSTGRPVTKDTVLYPGQIVQVQHIGSFWFAADVLETLADGKVMVRTRGFGNRDLTLTRNQVQLAPDELDQPNKPASLAADTQMPRTWTDSTGKNKVEAMFLGIEDNKVKLRRTDGKEIAVPLDRLSPADQEMAKKLQEAAIASDNPFE
jgi:hypothetical protein